ncbi:MAG: glycine-rich domain-containing protein [Casimicrobium sp.]
MLAMAIIVTLIGVLVTVIVVARWHHEQMWASRSGFITDYEFPEELRQKVGERRGHLRDEQIAEVFAALRNWFLLLQSNPETKLGMPSKVVDEAWHEFILMTRAYQEFCENAFGTFLHHEPNALCRAHAPNAALACTLELLTARALVEARFADSNLFEIDKKLGIQDGFHYETAQLDDLCQMRRRSKEAGELSVEAECLDGTSLRCADEPSFGDRALTALMPALVVVAAADKTGVR